MRYENEKLSLEEGVKREWIVTNGIGGYASSTIIGVNTRKYHRTTCSTTSTTRWQNAHFIKTR